MNTRDKKWLRESENRIRAHAERGVKKSNRSVVDNPQPNQIASSDSEPKERYAGFVIRFDTQKGYGFIGSHANARAGVFFQVSRVRRDCLGRRGISVGSPVEFELAENARGQCAIDVRNVDPALRAVDLVTHREFGRVMSWDGEAGYVRRELGDSLRFTLRSIITEGVETIRPGTVLRFRVGRGNNGAWWAADVEIFEPGFEPPNESLFAPGSVENYFLRSAELALDEVPEIQPLACLTPENRSKTFRELMAS